MQESATDELSDSTIDKNTSQKHNLLFHNPATPMPTHMPDIAPNPFFSNMQLQQVGNMFAVLASSQNSFLNHLNFPSCMPNINLLQPSVPKYPHQFYAYQQPILPNVNQTNCTQTQPHLEPVPFLTIYLGGAIAPPSERICPPSKVISAPEVRSSIAYGCCQNCS